jgi:hypothetical protein
MPLPNRVDPFGELFASRARGTLMGNRGGRFHTDHRTLGLRRWVSPQWICCMLEFNDRHRKVWGRSYTEVFFLDEVTALAAGHRPCFECRRRDAEAFADMDRRLHGERLNGPAKRHHRLKVDTLPDGAIVAPDNEAFAVRGNALLRWSPAGYAAGPHRPRSGAVDVLTPPAILAVLKAGYRPQWHASAKN